MSSTREPAESAYEAQAMESEDTLVSPTDSDKAPSTESEDVLVSPTPSYKTGRLYELLFRNPKAEFTVYGISLISAFTYAVINRVLLGRPEKTALYEGSAIAILVFLISILVYIYRDVFSTSKILESQTRQAIQGILSHTFVTVLVLGLVWLMQFLLTSMLGKDARFFDYIPVKWIIELAEIIIVVSFILEIVLQLYRLTFHKEEKATKEPAREKLASEFTHQTR